MLAQQKLFFLICIPARILLIVLAIMLSAKYLVYMGYAMLVPATGFAFIFLTNSRKTGPEVFGGKIWWDSIRPIHSLLYFAFSYNAIVGNSNAWMYLLADVVVGISVSLVHYSDIAALTSRDILPRTAHVAIHGGSTA